MNVAEYAAMDATALAEAIRTRQASPAEVLEAASAALDRVNHKLNFVAHDLREQARAAAASCQPDGVFAGVPFLLKDLALEMAGTPYGAGCRLLDGYVSPADSNLMTRFRDAGMIVLAKSSCAEFGAQLVTETRVGGVTRNPWNPSYTPGGSSGGSAAAVAAGVVPFAHANDGIGSIRIPASNCHLFGLKPNRQRLPLGPFIGDAPGSRGVEFVLTRSVRDAAAMLDAVHGPDVGAPGWAPPPERPYRDELSRPRPRLRIAFTTRSFSRAEVAPVCAEAVLTTARVCAELGHEVEEAAPTFDFATFRRAIRDESNAHSAAGLVMLSQALDRPLDETTLEPFTLQIYREGMRTPGDAVGRAAFVYGAVQRAIGAFFERYDLLLTPTLSRPPAEIGWMGRDPEDYEGFWDRFCGDAYSPFAGVFNVTGQPAASVPAIFDPEGLPIGTQIVGRFGADGTVINIAAQIEAASPWAGARPPIHAAWD